MASRDFYKVIRGIRELRVQGASDVRKAALLALAFEVKRIKVSNVSNFKRKVKSLANELMRSRPTEPEMHTALRHVIAAARKAKSVQEAKALILEKEREYEKHREEAMQAIAGHAMKVIPLRARVFTHCHSHTVMEVLKKAKQERMLKEVIFTETRPLMQGHLTAKDLSALRIPGRMIVSEAGFTFMKECDVFLTGADAVLHSGVVNKTGTASLSVIARYFNVPHYIASSTEKFTTRIEIEERVWSEVWKERIAGIQIENPAFDLTPKKLIKGVITEKVIRKKL